MALSAGPVMVHGEGKILDLRMPGPVTAYLGILADALTPCALFAIAFT
jgi:hypothetical protein